MATFTKNVLSASSSGTPIQVTSTAIATPTTIHVVPSGALDVITLYATNNEVVDVVLTIGWGGTGTEFRVNQLIPSQTGLSLVFPSIPLGAGYSVVAAASIANKILIVGHVERIS